MLPAEFAQSITWTAAFTSGLISFFSPCVLPLIPAYFGILAGGAAFAAQEKSRVRLFVTGLLFVTGFSLVFVVMGLSANALGQWLRRWKDVLRVAGGVFVILMGVFSMELFRVPFLQRERRADLGKIAQIGAGRLWMPPLLGVGFALGWTPCVGPILTSVLLMAANERTLLRGAGMLAVYSLGIGLPFLIIAALSNFMLPLIRRMQKHMTLLRRIGGALLVLMGILMLTGWLDRLAAL